MESSRRRIALVGAKGRMLAQISIKVCFGNDGQPAQICKRVDIVWLNSRCRPALPIERHAVPGALNLRSEELLLKRTDFVAAGSFDQVHRVLVPTSIKAFSGRARSPRSS